MKKHFELISLIHYKYTNNFGVYSNGRFASGIAFHKHNQNKLKQLLITFSLNSTTEIED